MNVYIWAPYVWLEQKKRRVIKKKEWSNAKSRIKPKKNAKKNIQNISLRITKNKAKDRIKQRIE